MKTLFFMLIAITVMFSACSKTDGRSMGVADQAADFTLESLTGEKIVLSEILKQRKAILLFWTTWCFACRGELPQIERFYLENKDKIAVIGIDVGESKAKARRFIQRIGVTYPIALDYDGEVAGAYKVRGVPTIVAIDKNARILYYGHSTEEMQDLVDF